jgi:hypothetical protein
MVIDHSLGQSRLVAHLIPSGAKDLDSSVVLLTKNSLGTT